MRTMPSSLFGVILLLAGCSQDSMSLDQVLTAHTDAMGGSGAIEGVTELEIELRLEEPTFSVTGTYVATREGRMRVDIFADDQRVFTEAFDGTAGWQLFQDESLASDMSPDGEAALIHGIHFNIFGLHELSDLGYKLTLAGRETVDNIDYWLVDSVSPSGFLKRHLINAETFLVERTREESALHPDIDPEARQFETILLDYREQSRRLFSFGTRKIDMATGEVVQSTEVVRLAVNPQIDSAIFDRP